MNLADLDAVNDSVNLLPYVADPEALDDWSPITDAGGDCDSYAVAKLRRLVALGWPVERLRLACCYVETGEYHAVLLVSAPEGDLMLDNRQPRPVPAGDVVSLLGYRTDRIQRVGGTLDWVSWIA